MNSRMERYNSEVEEEKPISRVNRNSLLYQDIKTSELSRVSNNDNVKVIENNGKTINIDKIRRYIEESNIETKARKSVRIDLPNNNETVNIKEDNTPKDYDINSVLEKARQKREINYESERYKKLRDTQYDILSKIKMYESEEVPSKEDLEKDFNTDERTLIDLINTVTIHKGDVNLLEDLMATDGEETTDPIEKEIEKANKIKEENILETDEAPKIIEVDKEKLKELEKTQELVSLKEKSMDIDKSFYTNSTIFDKSDFDGFDEIEKNVKKSGLMSIIMLVLIVIFIIATLVIMANYVFELGLF